MTRSKQVVHWTSETWWDWDEIAGSIQGSPQEPTPSVVKLEGGSAASMKPGQKSCVRSSGIITLSAQGPSDGLGRALLRRGHNDQSCQGHQCSETMLTGESRFHISTPLRIWTQVPHDRQQTASPLDQWDMVRMKWDCRLSTKRYRQNATNNVCRFSHYFKYRNPYLRSWLWTHGCKSLLHSSLMLLPDCPSHMQLAPTPSLAILELTHWTHADARIERRSKRQHHFIRIFFVQYMTCPTGN